MQHPATQTDEDIKYVARYVDLIKGKDVMETLSNQSAELIQLVQKLSEEEGLYRYAADKWSIKQLLGHMIDTERIMSYRAMCISRGETQPLPGFDENAYASAAAFDKRSFSSLLTEYEALRKANIALFNSLSAEELERTGSANGKTFKVSTLISLIAGHEAHHMNILTSRYLKQ